MGKREEIQRSREVIAETAKLILEYRHCNVDLVFDTIISEQMTLSTDITDHIVEDHTTVQDHITIKPKIFTMKGLVSEKVYNSPDSVEIEVPEEPWNAKLAKLAVLAPSMASYVSSAITSTEIANKAGQFINKGFGIVQNGVRKILKLLGWKPNANLIHTKWSDDMLQLTAITLLETCRINRIPVKVQTGWGEYLENNYYITDISVNQGDTYQQLELSVTVKELRFTNIKMADLTKEKYDRYSQMNQEMVNTNAGSTEQELTSQAWKAAHS